MVKRVQIYRLNEQEIRRFKVDQFKACNIPFHMRRNKEHFTTKEQTWKERETESLPFKKLFRNESKVVGVGWLVAVRPEKHRKSL